MPLRMSERTTPRQKTHTTIATKTPTIAKSFLATGRRPKMFPLTGIRKPDPRKGIVLSSITRPLDRAQDRRGKLRVTLECLPGYVRQCENVLKGVFRDYPGIVVLNLLGRLRIFGKSTSTCRSI